MTEPALDRPIGLLQACAMVVGIIIGTYSSIFIASPILVFWQNVAENRRRNKLRTAPVVETRTRPVAKTEKGVPEKGVPKPVR